MAGHKGQNFKKRHKHLLHVEYYEEIKQIWGSSTTMLKRIVKWVGNLKDHTFVVGPKRNKNKKSTTLSWNAPNKNHGDPAMEEEMELDWSENQKNKEVGTKWTRTWKGKRGRGKSGERARNEEE